MKPSSPKAHNHFPAESSTPLLYRISSVMSLLEVSRSTVYRMVARRDLEIVKLSRRATRITSASVDRVLARRK
jgi:excisionase family DNA binding protein